MDLKDLIVDEEKVNEEVLYQVLAPYIGIGSTTNTILLKPEFYKLSDSKKKILIYLTARKALAFLGKLEGEGVGPTEVAKKTNIKKGTVFPAIRKLEDEGLVENDDGKYFIANHNITKIKEILDED